MNDLHTETEVERKVAVADRGRRARNGHDDAAREERDRGLVIARVIHHIGGGIRWTYNRNLAWALAISVGLHLLLIAMYALSTSGDDAKPRYQPPSLAALDSILMDTNAIRISLEPITIVDPGGGGGDPLLDKPVGKSKAGDPNAQPKYTPEKPNNDKSKVFEPKAPNAKPVDKPRDDRPVATTDRDTAKGPSSGAGLKGQHADGKGTADAGGSGGRGEGHGRGDGVGNGSGVAARGWARKPSSRPFDGMEAEGSVTLKFTVMPNGAITAISPVRTAHPSLLRVAIERLKAAKVNPIPPGAPQKTVPSQYTFNFKMPN
jgi:TonB family protein